MDAAVAGLIGAGIGSITSLLVVWVQAHYQSKRERARSILDLAMRDRSISFEHADKLTGPSVILPLAVHVHFQDQLMKLLEAKDVTEASLVELHRKNNAVIAAIQNDQKVRREALAHEVAKRLRDEQDKLG